MDSNIISTRLRELRSLKGVSQDAAAEACEISRVGLARYETGQRVPVVKIASKLAEYYGVSVEYLLGKDSVEAQAQEKAPTNSIDAQIMKELEGLEVDQLREVLNFIRFRKKGGSQ